MASDRADAVVRPAVRGARSGIPVEPVAADDVEGALDVLCDAFHDYPVMRFVLGTEREYEQRLRTLIRMFTLARVLRQEPLLGVRIDGVLRGVALVSNPAGPPAPAAFTELRERVWDELGAEARERYEVLTSAWSRFTVEGPQLHLNMLAVERPFQGQGISSALLHAVHAMAERIPDSIGVTLSTEARVNLRIYERFGYRIIGHAVITPRLESWGMLRPAQPSA